MIRPNPCLWCLPLQVVSWCCGPHAVDLMSAATAVALPALLAKQQQEKLNATNNTLTVKYDLSALGDSGVSSASHPSTLVWNGDVAPLRRCLNTYMMFARANFFNSSLQALGDHIRALEHENLVQMEKVVLVC